MGETTMIFQRRIRHWKTTIGGFAIMGLGIASFIWPNKAALFSQISTFLTASAFMAAADGKQTPAPPS